MNTTIQVATLLDCDRSSFHETIENAYDPIWRQTITGCKMLDILKDMYGFTTSYAIDDLKANMDTIEQSKRIYTPQNVSIDLYLRPMSLRLDRIETLFPVDEAYSCRVGFLIPYNNDDSSHYFYIKPFTRTLWNCLFGMAFLISMLFYYLKKWELDIIGGIDCSYPYELLMVIGGYCQHIPPIEASLSSRRIAYLSFFLFAYIIYTYYTSNLLSDLVNHKDSDITLSGLAHIKADFVIAEYMMLTLSENIPYTTTHYSEIMKRLHKLRSVSLVEGLEGVKAGKSAMLVDYLSTYPFLTKIFSAQELCDISKVVVFPHVSKYFFISKQLSYKEEFKIGLLRIKEVGVLKRWMLINSEEPKCVAATLGQTKFSQISSVITILLGVYAGCLLLLVLENAYYQYCKRSKVFPYVE